MSEHELTDLEGMDWDDDGGYWYSVVNGDVSPFSLLAYTIWLRDENASLEAKIVLLSKDHSALCTKCGYMRPATEIEKENAELKRELDTERSMRHEAQSDYGNQIETLAKLKQGIESAHLHLLASICECGEPLKETDAFDVLDALLKEPE